MGGGYRNELLEIASRGEIQKSGCGSSLEKPSSRGHVQPTRKLLGAAHLYGLDGWARVLIKSNRGIDRFRGWGLRTTAPQAARAAGDGRDSDPGGNFFEIADSSSSFSLALFFLLARGRRFPEFRGEAKRGKVFVKGF